MLRFTKRTTNNTNQIINNRLGNKVERAKNDEL